MNRIINCDMLAALVDVTPRAMHDSVKHLNRGRRHDSNPSGQVDGFINYY
jgi:hypothetical protein